MKAIIIEDEALASQALQNLINEIEPDIDVVAISETIEDSVEWFETHDMPDLVFMDIHLADGPSFAIFESIDITCPIVFTTAYDEYALKAFEVNSIDYLLKPINRNDLERALNKFKNLTAQADTKGDINNLLAQFNAARTKHKTCFLIPERDKLIPLATNNIACIFIDLKNVKALSHDGRTYCMNQTLDELMNQLDTEMFFRANRQFIVSRLAIKDISIWFGNKLSLNLNVKVPENIIISKARVSEFKAWFSR